MSSLFFSFFFDLYNSDSIRVFLFVLHSGDLGRWRIKLKLYFGGSGDSGDGGGKDCNNDSRCNLIVEIQPTSNTWRLWIK
ncbi:uncharacterized protein LOC114915044 isoform X2 [Cajanus cajan]|uniref:uncharacterized protein LOC114915044 isoform X2 n=1 Tax=Cajanus cajan TaxID=3821 RepID=UPI0010FAEDFA|nr:uncharacterized protein LOC114915044 isoform X2 [Cajanus cajan]